MASSPTTPPPPALLKYSTGALATMGACLFSNPFEVMKTRLQLQGELQSKTAYEKVYRNVFHAMLSVYRNEGIRGVQAGLGLGLVYQAAMNGSRLSCFDFIKDKHQELTGRPFTWPENMAAAAVSGAISALFGSPFYLVKTQQQAQSAVVKNVGFQHQHKSALGAFRHIVQTEGVWGLWRGLAGSIPRLMVGSSVQLTSYSQSKVLLQKVFPSQEEGIVQQFGASMMAGACVALAMNPFDVIMTRLYNQPVDPVTKRGVYYAGFLDAMKKVAAREGLHGFYKGVGALYLRIGPHTMLTFVFWERLRNWIGAAYV